MPDEPLKPWGRKNSQLPGYVMDDLYQVYHFLDKQTLKRVGLMMEIPVFIKDPLVAVENPLLGIQEIAVRLEEGFSDGPTSSRIAVVDFNSNTQTLTEPVVWDEDQGWFRLPLDVDQPEAIEWLPEAPRDISRVKDQEKYRQDYAEFIEKTVRNPYFHQLNVWAVVQRVLEFYEEEQALGRPVPWGFDGNRLIVVPHAGYGENAFYDQNSKSLQFYYFGDQEKPGFTCLSFDIIAHETGHAVLDGIRPFYNQVSSVQTAAFHEFVGDLTAILLALFNRDIRQFVSQTTEGKLAEADVLANIAPEFGNEVQGRPYLRTAFNDQTMADVQDSLSPHNVSQVLTGAMFDILTGIATKHLEKNLDSTREVSPDQALWWAADRFRRVALQPLDLCPPCDIQFIDYAKAVIRNDLLTNPVDEQGYRQIMLDIFHQRGLCTCDYVSGQDLPADCQFLEVYSFERMRFVYHDIGRVSRSRTAAYYFLNDNRNILHIPAHQDVQVVDLYDNSKYGVAAERLPREIVLEYLWQEEVTLVDDPEKDLSFGRWNGKTYNLDCGGTLVFDGRGNLLSWFRKPGTEHITGTEAASIRERNSAWDEDPDGASEQKIKKPTKLELAQIDDLEIGHQRKAALLHYLAAMIRRGLVGDPGPENLVSEGLNPVVAVEDAGKVRFETTPHLRKSDFDNQEAGWRINY
ncbi:MAG: hypothetical protein ACWGOY_08410 [Anaerolineales bacterium]